jgi:hypothetical protein
MSDEQDNCADHDWWFEVGDTCPVCEGISAEQTRIIKLLEDYDFSTIWRQVEWNPPAWESFGSDELIELIKGETK